MKRYRTIPEKGVLQIIRISILLQAVLLLGYLLHASVLQRDIQRETSPIITLAICLGAVSILLREIKRSKRLNGFVLTALITLETLISISLPLVFTSQLNETEFLIGFWLFIPSSFIPLAIVAIQYDFVSTLFYCMIANVLDLAINIYVQYMASLDINAAFGIIQEYNLLLSALLRIPMMVLMGHIVSVLVQSSRETAEQLESANTELAELNQHLEERVFERTKALQTTNEKTLQGWVRLMELRHLEPVGHTARLLKHAAAFGKKLGLSKSDQEILEQTILLHDVGKLGIPDQILLKPTKLNEQEYAHSKLHVDYSVQILQGIEFLAPSIHVIASHHERWNGTGYPQGLRGKEIPFITRIFAVLEIYDVLTHDTVYRPGWPDRKARKHLRDNAGILYDPLIVTQFLGLLETLELEDMAGQF